jgi:two-component system, HptB-dependent secretion and biofilm response regulator
MSSEENTSNRILVVDDDIMLNDYFCFFLESKGMEVVSAYSLQQAIDKLQVERHLDLVLLDYQLGDGIGVDFLTSDIYLAYPKPLPVIMVSSNEDPEFLKACFESGISDYVIKPVNLSLLSLKVQSLLSSVKLNNLILAQKRELENYKKNSLREESIAKFTYEYLVRQSGSEIPGIKTWLRSCSSFSGDMVLSKASPNGNVYFMLADATGHGLSAAITIMPVVSIFNSMVAKGFHIQQIVTEINKKVLRDTPLDRFVAAIVVELHREKREISVWNGAMPAGYWYCEGEMLREFTSKNMAFGILEEKDFEVNLDVCEFAAKGELFVFSDGLLEQSNASGELFSLARLKELLACCKEFPASIIEEFKLHAGADHFEDDVSLCSLRFSEIFENPENIITGSILKALFDRPPFAWSVTLQGNNIADCDLPPLLNSYLQGFGFGLEACQKIFLILSEMVSNAIDHGVLQLSSDLKSGPEGFVAYFYERELRMGKLKADDVVEVSVSWLTDGNDPRLMICVRDSGQGYEARELKNLALSDVSGRGLGLIKRLSSSVEVVGPGNLIRVTIR